jgi:hypothetical protein
MATTPSSYFTSSVQYIFVFPSPMQCTEIKIYKAATLCVALYECVRVSHPKGKIEIESV